MRSRITPTYFSFFYVCKSYYFQSVRTFLLCPQLILNSIRPWNATDCNAIRPCWPGDIVWDCIWTAVYSPGESDFCPSISLLKQKTGKGSCSPRWMHFKNVLPTFQILLFLNTGVKAYQSLFKYIFFCKSFSHWWVNCLNCVFIFVCFWTFFLLLSKIGLLENLEILNGSLLSWRKTGFKNRSISY